MKTARLRIDEIHRHPHIHRLLRSHSQESLNPLAACAGERCQVHAATATTMPVRNTPGLPAPACFRCKFCDLGPNGSRIAGHYRLVHSGDGAGLLRPGPPVKKQPASSANPDNRCLTGAAPAVPARFPLESRRSPVRRRLGLRASVISTGRRQDRPSSVSSRDPPIVRRPQADCNDANLSRSRPQRRSLA